MVVLHIYIGHGVVAAEDNVGNLGRAQGAGDKQGRVGSPVDDIDVFITQLADDAMDTCSFHTDTSANGVDAVVIGLHSHLGTLARLADNLLDGDEAVVNLGHLGFEQTLQENLGSTRKRDHR